MKNIKSIVLPFLICFFIYGCNAQSKDTEKKRISILNEVDKTATKLLYDKIISNSKTIKNGNKILVDNASIEINSKVEFDGKNQGNWIYATNFSTIIKASENTEFNIGSIGIGNSREEAIKVSIQEWFAIFGIPLSDMLNNKNGDKISEKMVFSGLMGIRGDLPKNTWLNGDSAMTTKIISHIDQLIKVTKDEIVYLDIKLMIMNNSIVDGECKLGNQVSIELLNQLKNIDWPVSEKGYLFKQFYIIKKI